MKPRQLTFDLAQTETYARADFFASPANASALTALAHWQSWPAGKLVLIGPEGAGKTHLAHIWAAESGANLLTPNDLQTDRLPSLGALIVLDNADLLAGNPALETALFHLHNLVMAAGGRLLLTARTPPRDWGLGLPDLLSRLQATPLTRLDPPDDALLSAVLIKLFADRQITVPPNLIPYLTSRMDRSIAAARALVMALDALALSNARPVTRALAADLLDRDRPE